MRNCPIVALQVHIKTGNVPTFVLSGHGFKAPVCTSALESAAELFRVSCHDIQSMNVVVDLVEAECVDDLDHVAINNVGCYDIVTSLFKSSAKADSSTPHTVKVHNAGDHQLSPARDTICDWLRFLLVPVRPFKA